MPNPAPKNFATLGTLALMMAFSSIATDLYLPAFPAMAHALGSDPGLIEASMATFLSGFVLGQLFWGPASDAYGRKPPALLGICLFCAASALCASAASGEAVLLWRALQGFGGSAAVVIARAIVTDLYDEDDAAKVMSSLIAIMAIAPLAGPLVGAQILELSGWRAIFWALCGLSLVALLLTLRIPESNPSDDRRPLLAGMSSFADIARSPQFLSYAVCGSAFYAGLFAFLTAAPSVFIDEYGFSPTAFAALLAFGTALVIAANVVNVKLIGPLGLTRTLRLGSGLAALAGCGVLLVASVVPANVAMLIAVIMAFMTTAGLVIANSLTGAIASFASSKGTASAVAGAMNFAGGGLGAIVVALWRPGSALGLAAALAIFGTLTWLASLRIDAVTTVATSGVIDRG